jgi:NADH:ubiquinone oxidoreductase subunit F (NADH-binding)/NADPH-dependent glutamate synthase beta subunit-like oxidoreductase/(2Fe-2S) ferredoxin
MKETMMVTQKKLMQLEDLEAIKRKVADERRRFAYHAMICSGTSCQASESLRLRDTLVQELLKHDLSNRVHIVETGCMGFCAVGPLMRVDPDDYFYQKLTLPDISEIVKEHFLKGRPVQRLMYRDPVSGRMIPHFSKIPFIAPQQLVVLHNRGIINPEKIDDYIWRNGYQATFKALTTMAPNEIVSEAKASGLRGRGGGGFPTGLKWELCAASKEEIKYILCNADEGDPGAFMDRSVLEADPHAVLEGMIVAAKAIDAHHGYIYCRAEYPIAIQRLNIAIRQAGEYGLLGKDIFGSGFDFDIEVYRGAGAFVCGEETALMTSIEGRRGMPRPRPPFPAVSGLWGKPSVLNNVETYANIPHIINHGGDRYAEVGTDSSKGTKIFSLTGKVNNQGLVEVPMGTTLGTVIFEIGGGMANDKKYKAAQLGGPSGGCLPVEHLNTPIDYEEITKAGAIMGSGGMIIMDEDTCMVDMARFFMDFCRDESCGKCTACRIGTKRMLEILERICRGQGRDGDIELLEDLAKSIKDTALCGLGQTAPNPVLSTIRYFRDEYEAHIKDKRCPAVVCSELFDAPCQHMCPVGMDIPAYIALVRARRYDDAYKVLTRTNPFPIVCGRVCGHPCQSKCRRGQLDAPLAIKNLKRFITDYATRPRVETIPISQPEKIAVIGAGPAGLTMALEMKKRGYAVTVFEQLPEAGGMLRWGIPEYRLPRDLLDQEIQDILNTGVTLRTNTCIGKDIGFEELQRNFEIIYIAAGAQKSMPLGISGDDAEGVFGAVEWLREYNMGKRVKVGRHVAVVGGGNSAVDAARTAVRLGAETVTIYYRRERKDMPAQEDEISAAEEEGIHIRYLVAPEKILLEKGKVSGMVSTKMRLEAFDRSGRRRPVPIEGSRFTDLLDMIISAVGQTGDFNFLKPESTVETTRTTIKVDTGLKTTNPKVWAGGDVVTGPAMVIDAIRAGRDASQIIDTALRTTKGQKPWTPTEEPIEIPFEADEEAVEQAQMPMPELDGSARKGNFAEVEIGYTEEMALAEAGRCMRCDGKNSAVKAA